MVDLSLISENERSLQHTLPGLTLKLPLEFLCYALSLSCEIFICAHQLRLKQLLDCTLSSIRCNHVVCLTYTELAHLNPR
jgi:hypothetical protein